MNGLLEILTTKKWMMAPDHLNAIRQTLQHNLSTHAAFTPEKKVMGRAMSTTGEQIQAYCLDEDGQWIGGSYEGAAIKQPFVNVLDVTGPITRGGGVCTFGSAEHRDMILAAADNENCRGHIFYINTPGGSAWAKNDYQQAIDYARSKGQPVLAFIDGLCCSAGMYLASLCDERYYMHPNDEIGCIGVMAAFYTTADGAHNEYTNETYHELYDPESSDKNKWSRDIANNDDDKLLIAELSALGREFRADVKKACPTATNKHLKGRIFAAKDVKGILVDGQAGFGDVVARCFGLADGTISFINRPTPIPLDDEELIDETSNQSDYTMDNKYKNLAAACGVDELVITEEGTHLDISLVDSLTEKLDNDAKAINEANALNESLQQKLNDKEEATTTALNEQKEGIVAEHAAAIEALKAEHAKALDALKDEHAAALEKLNAEKTTTEQALATANEHLAAAEQKVADRDAQIKELTESAAAAPAASPANNGEGVHEASINVMPAYDERKSAVENAKILADWKKANQG